MEINFIKFNENKELFDLTHIINNIPPFIEKENEYELWHNCARKATKNGTELSSYSTVVAIFNNIFNKKLKNNKVSYKDRKMQSVEDAKTLLKEKDFKLVAKFKKQDDISDTINQAKAYHLNAKY